MLFFSLHGTYHRHLESLFKKLISLVAFLRQLAGSGWGAGATTLQIATTALVHSTAKYCMPAWCRSAHTYLINPAINDALRIVTRCLLPSPVDNLPTCWASSQWSHTVSSTPSHGAWTSAPLSAHPSIKCECTAPQIETPICTRRNTSHHFFWQQQHTCGAVGGLPMEYEVDG